MNEEMTEYRKAVTYLFSLQKFGIKFGLSKTSNLLKAFGNPHIGQKYVHVAGTNGKGSVAVFLASILQEAGYRVGLYTSPHLVRFTERFKINGREITRAKAATLIEELRIAMRPEEPPTFFEATTAMALAFFARENTDIAIIEVGMGGRLDATNIITPLVSVITNISLEHQLFLGSRLRDIAYEKGGIIKEGIDVLTGTTQRDIIRFLQSLCVQKKAPMWRVGKDIRYRATGSGLHYRGINRRFDRLELGLKGKFQNRNAALAIAVIERLEEKGFRVSPQHIREGLSKSIWPGRMQVIADKPTILLDGAHNPTAIRALAKAISAVFKYRQMILIIGIMEDKAIYEMLRGIVPLSDYVIYTRPVYPRAASPELLMEKGASFHKSAEVVPSLTQAIDRAKEMANPQDLIVICGSLFTVGEAMTHFDAKAYRPDDL
jgi:dihydrofolate synthase/folylpolyglutamate synthase